jgi:hypothetical protein
MPLISYFSKRSTAIGSVFLVPITFAIPNLQTFPVDAILSQWGRTEIPSQAPHSAEIHGKENKCSQKERAREGLNCERVGQCSQQSRAVSRLPGLPDWACKSLCTLAFTSLRTHGVCHIQHTRHGSSWPLLRGSSLSPDDDPHPLT